MKILKFIGLIRALQTKLVHTSLVFQFSYKQMKCTGITTFWHRGFIYAVHP